MIKRQVKVYSVKSELQVLAVNPQLHYQKLNQPAGFFTLLRANFFNHLWTCSATQALLVCQMGLHSSPLSISKGFVFIYSFAGIFSLANMFMAGIFFFHSQEACILLFQSCELCHRMMLLKYTMVARVWSRRIIFD